MIKVHKRITTNASPDQVWAVLGNLGRAPDYIPGIVSAHVDGMQRHCKDQNDNDIREEIRDYSPQTRRYAFRHIQSPLPVRNSQGSFRVDADDAGSLIEMIWELDLLDPSGEPEMTPMIENAAQMTLENLRQRAEAEV